jgi:hypothetical protein
MNQSISAPARSSWVPSHSLFENLVHRQELELLTSSGPTTKVVASPTFRRDQHICKAPALSMAIKSSELGHRREHRSGFELITVRHADGQPKLFEAGSGTSAFKSMRCPFLPPSEIANLLRLHPRSAVGIFVCMDVNPAEKLPRLASYGVL